jgi:hypothetical protein
MSSVQVFGSAIDDLMERGKTVEIGVWMFPWRAGTVRLL